MSKGPDGDDELDLEELEADALQEESAPVRAAPPAFAPPEAARPAVAALPALATTSAAGAPDCAEAAAADAAADAALYAGEVAASTDDVRRALLSLEVARLEGEALGHGDAALAAARAAHAAAPDLFATLGTLRPLLAARAAWGELVTALEATLARATLSPDDRADLLVERGRLLADRLGRDGDAATSFEEALSAAPEHAGALLALFAWGARAGDPGVLSRALGGLARRAETPARRVALAASLAELLRASGNPADEVQALRVVREALRARAAEDPVAPLLAELDALSRTARQPAVQARALAELAHHDGLDAAWVAALLRERARLLRDVLEDPKGALDAVEGAARLAPAHPLVAADALDLAETLGRFDVVERVVARFESAAGRDGERAQALALRQVRALGRVGRYEEALAVLDGSAILRRSAGQPAVFGLRVALLARARDGVGLAEAFAAEGARAGGASGARALTFAGAARQFWVGDPAGAEDLYRRAVVAAPAERPAWDALESLLREQRRWPEVAALLEDALAEVAGAPAAAERELTLREELLALYRDELGDPARALGHAQHLVHAAPKDVRRRVRLRDLELAGGIDASDAAEAAAREVETLRALAEGADEPAVAAALDVEAARLLRQSSDPAARERALALLGRAAASDVTGLATAALEATLGEPGARSELVARELEGAMETGAVEVQRALRFRLAHLHAASGRYAEAVATLTPLRAERDPLARAWSWDLARRSGDAILEVAVLSDEARDNDHQAGRLDDVAAPGDVTLAYAEALERAGDGAGAGEAFAQALARAKEGAPSADAALGLLRVVASSPTVGTDALVSALDAVAAACADDPKLVAAVQREQAMLRVAAGGIEAADLASGGAAGLAGAGASPAERAETAVVRWASGVTRGDAGAISEALVDLGRGTSGGASSPEAIALLSRASARARLAGAARSDEVHRRLWQLSHAPELAAALSDLPVAAGEGWPAERPDPRRARAARVGGPLGATLDLEAGLEAERRGALGAALASYGRVVANAPDHLEAWEGIRRVARAGDDALGEARALCRLGTLVRVPAVAVALRLQAARLFEQVGRWDDAIALWGHALELAPDDAEIYGRLHDLLLGDVEAPGRAEALDRLLGHRLAAATLDDEARVAVLFERALHRAQRLADDPGAVADFKRILKIEPKHVEALWGLAQAALDTNDAAGIAAYLERFVAAAPDDPRAVESRLTLARAHETTGDRARAIEALRRAAVARPDDPVPVERLVDLYTRLGEWRSAVEVLRDWEGRLPDARDRAALQLRVGAILRDAGRDATSAAVAFRRAAELDPMGEGNRALLALHDTQGDARGAAQMIEREIAELRVALARDPLDVQRLDRLAHFLAELARRAPSPVVAEARAAIQGALALLGAPARQTGEDAVKPAAPLRALAPRAPGAFWDELAFPGALGFRAEIWPHLVESALALFPEAGSALPARARRLNPGEEPRLAWLEATASACGLAAVRIYLSPSIPDATPAVIVDHPEVALVLGPAALDPKPATRFAVGRALSLLRAQAGLVDRVEPSRLGPLFAAAAEAAGAAPPKELGRADEQTERIVGKAMSRRDRKALALQSSRFGFESVDPTRWGQAVRRTADRLGLLLSGDVAACALAAARGDPARWKSAVKKAADRLGHILESDAPPPAEGAAGDPTTLDEIRGSERALDLLRFVVGAAYPLLRRQAEGEV
jgi:tetratricopeptide (TPR) repeat protein